MRTLLRCVRLSALESYLSATSIAPFLYPSLAARWVSSAAHWGSTLPTRQRVSTLSRRRFASAAAPAVSGRPAGSVPVEEPAKSDPPEEPAKDAPPEVSPGGKIANYRRPDDINYLPTTCPGCGALSQVVEPDVAGFYDTSRKVVRGYIKQERRRIEPSQVIIAEEDSSKAEVAAPETPKEPSGPETKQAKNLPIPFCDRCHALQNHSLGESIAHPSLQSIADTIAESPHNYNHVYHVLDAADFPMSLVPHINSALSLSHLRTQNRRSKSSKYSKGRQAELSFIITRSDLLAPSKEQVDALQPYLTGVLRDALKTSKRVRLGNVRCVSAKRGWWTKTLKEEIWERGGGGWMVGKVNVGKSNLFETVFPKGGVLGDVEQDLLPEEVQRPEAFLDPNSLLPPLQPETPYPVMPLVSSVPGTTASPIRIAFGQGKGELVDLPGLSRGDLELFVQPKHRSDLVMRSRIKPEQHVIKPGQSLLLGGLIRITPLTEVQTLAYPFVPIPTHITSTQKAIDIQTQQRELNVPSIATPDAAGKIQSAGTFELKWDITRHRAGPLTKLSKPEQLPFQIFGTDILIEGCGWVELVMQVRRKDAIEMIEEIDEYGNKQMVSREVFPQVEVFTPEGRFVGQRAPMHGWLLAEKHKETLRDDGMEKKRPRRSMKGMKKKGKIARRGGGP
ncbi:MAG: hypothetical protein M1823_003116 [Watsoniomyces obsoletus]|nr:MAG: hypothetical protein M1823_003116 [Watsoniomyces obsoletus]